MTLAKLRLVTQSPEVKAIDPSLRGYSVLYRGAETPCPGCGRHHWDVRRLTAECFFCATALPIPASNTEARG